MTTSSIPARQNRKVETTQRSSNANDPHEARRPGTLGPAHPRPADLDRIQRVRSMLSERWSRNP